MRFTWCAAFLATGAAACSAGSRTPVAGSAQDDGSAGSGASAQNDGAAQGDGSAPRDTSPEREASVQHDAAAQSDASAQRDASGGPTLGGRSIEFGRTLYGTDDAVRADVPTGGTLFSVWTKVPDPGPIPWTRGNMDVYVLYGANWHIRCLTGNGAATSTANATLNANSMLFVDPSGEWVDDYSYYLGTGLPAATVVGWVWAAWQVVQDSNSFTIREWLKFGIDGQVFAAGQSNPTLADVRTTLVNQRGFPASQAAAWVPSGAISFQVGKDNGNLIHARIEATNAMPTLAHLDEIARASAADTTAWADYELTWVDGAANLKDRSGHARDLSIDTGGTLYQGPAGPAFQ
jgi:hypothetical protein